MSNESGWTGMVGDLMMDIVLGWRPQVFDCQAHLVMLTECGIVFMYWYWYLLVYCFIFVEVVVMERFLKIDVDVR